MRLQTKTTSFYLGTTLIMVFTIILVSLLSFRQFSIKSAKSHSQSVAEIVRVGLTEQMINGSISKRSNLLLRLKKVKGLVSTRITRSDHVRKQYKEGLESEKIQDNIDRKVLTSGKAVFILENEGLNPILRSTIPFIADNEGTPNCLTCHQVPVGTVLGAITIRTAIGQLKTDALVTVAIISAVVIFFAIVTLYFFRRLFQPLITTAEDVQKAVANAKGGIFDVRVKHSSDDEIGRIATDLNALMDYLSEGLAHINKSVSQLINLKGKGGKDSLANTINMIDSLADASMFKQSIEEDETKEEVYQRLGRIIQEDFYVNDFSVYEIDSGAKNKINPVIVDGIPDAACKWCDPQIMIRADACRAKRTGHLIDSVETPLICNYFNNNGDNNKQHICLPIIQSGTVGSVVQVICEKEEGKHFQELVPFMQPFLREASPVIETKRLMATLKESNLRDAMTGLNNRRFLEEYVETMVANTNRNKSSISILMLDLDYFKKVNDTHGHDIGDKVLVELSKILVKSVRTSDMVIRYGGEEFLIILQNTSEKYGDQMAEKIRLAVEDMKVQTTGTVIQKTISIGVSDFPDDSESFWQALKYADVALYKAKEQGRNQAVHFSPEMWADHEEF